MYQIWALVVVRDGMIDDIYAVPRDRSSFMKAHYLDGSVVDVAPEFSGIGHIDLDRNREQAIRTVLDRLHAESG